MYELSAMGLPFVPTQGNFMMVEVGEAMRVYEALLREGVIVRPRGGIRLSAPPADFHRHAAGERRSH